MAAGASPVEAVGVTPAFWAGRRVFLTGHTGFKGGWLALWLHRLGAQVTGFALPPATTPALYDLARVDTVLDAVTGDIREAGTLAAALRRARPEVVFHLAAQPLVLESYADPLGTYATNVMGTANLLEAVRAAGGVRAVVVVTTDKCYAPSDAPAGHREEDRLGGYDPYSSSKACAELVTEAWRASYFPAERHATHGVAVASVRAGNVIGGGDWSAHRLVPDLLGAFAAGTPAAVRHPGAVRPWQHVLEPLAGYLALAERLAGEGTTWGTAWNFGPDAADMRPVAQVADLLAEAWGRGAEWRAEPMTEAPRETPVLLLDSARARDRLGWAPRWSLPEALTHIAAWERARLAGADMQAVTLAQIDAYAVEAHRQAGFSP